jgi:hypothetical protein
MKILSHRGFWLNPEEKNKQISFKRAVDCGYGIETDIRDYNGKLVISHDIPNEDCLQLDDFLQKYSEQCVDQTQYPIIALNIKSDGLCYEVKSLMRKYDVNNYFVFDMSIPDTFPFLEANLNVFTRISEYEKDPLLLEGVTGVWMDGFLSDWYEITDILKFINKGLKVCIVSSELHGRDNTKLWHKLKESQVFKNNNIMLCTDFPSIAEEFFE